jgi:hypothetical protein
MHIYIWAILNILMLIMLFILSMKLTHSKQNVLLILLVLLYPQTKLSSAGWIATTINYL